MAEPRLYEEQGPGRQRGAAARDPAPTFRVSEAFGGIDEPKPLPFRAARKREVEIDIAGIQRHQEECPPLVQEQSRGAALIVFPVAGLHGVTVGAEPTREAVVPR